MSDVMTGRERIVVSASDTLERVLERVRSSGAAELVLDVDERSALLLNLQHLHSLDETAQEQGVRLAIASTNTRLLNAARVFGLEVIDTRGAPPVAAPAPAGRLLAGQPLGHLDVEEAIEDAEVVEEAPPPAPAKPAVPARPTVQLRPASRPIRPVPKPSQAKLAEPESEPERDAATDDKEGWDEPPAPVARARQEPAAAPPPTALPVQQRATSSRLDPYGQPYTEQPADEDDADPVPSRGARTIRSLRPGGGRRATTGPSGEAEDGWDDEAEAYADDEYAEDYADEPQRRPGLLDGIASFWADVRAWIDARRGVGTADDYEEDEQADPGEQADDDGWDEPPYRARLASRQADATTVQEPAEDAPAEGEEPAEEEVTPTPVRPIRPIAVGRGPASAVEEAPAAQLRPFVASVTTFDDDEDDFDQVIAGAGWRQRRAARGGARFAVGGLVGVGLAVVLVLLLALYIVLPAATVTLVARTGTISADFNVVVGEIDPNSPQGQPTQERIVVPAKRITVPLKATGSKPATGARLEPDVTAGGPVVLNNSSSSAITVAKGTTLTAEDGRTYVTLEGVTIGPADRFAGVFGSATVTVAAGLKGSGGNAAIGAVKGQLNNDISFINKVAPIAGGSDRRIQTIAQQDIDAARAAAEATVRGQAQGALNGAIPAGSTIMHDTTGVGNIKATFSAQAGADGDGVTATVTAEVTALVYTQGDVEAQGRAEAERRLNAAAKPGEPIVAGSMQIDAPQVVNDVPGQLTYKVTGTARTRAAIGGDAQRAQLAGDLAGKSDDDAHQVIAAVPGVSSSTIDYATGPFPHRMPWLASHITVRIADAP